MAEAIDACHLYESYLIPSSKQKLSPFKGLYTSKQIFYWEIWKLGGWVKQHRKDLREKLPEESTAHTLNLLLQSTEG